ncbi:PREDICTED: D-beta-hydroxybutyrate dehydrogenase, mitochondrial [Wasmannia auropunctata]|uniref:D-beta-hydroxybutyrate dehydrogenase, mitochondrial n=1 Tax=Wasmannia auropunctata TaxID=64793 RepID=UPI0005EF8998|nr:PREDICTED: D-beta-hydroxybutyrate dehydrogenase, mitochondrial [Wasmannia auropunctata]
MVDERPAHNLKMNSVEEVYGSGWAAWWRKHSMALQIGTTISCNIAYLVDAGYTRKAAMLSMILLGGATLYCFFGRRRTISARDLIVITGCNSGLGYSLAMHCRARGATVLAGVREIAAVSNSNAAVEALENKGIIVHHLDITNAQSTRDFRDKVRKLLEEQQLVLRALVNNAGVMVFGEFEWQTQHLAEHQINVNLLGTMRITRELMPILRGNRSRIIMVSSHCADQPLPGISIYGATKAALTAWTTSLRTEVGKYGIEVVSFIPGGFVSESNIMKRQRLHFDEMRRHMSDEAKRFYGNYFTRYAEYFSQVSPTRNQGNVKVLSEPRIYEIFDNALLNIYPSAVYRCESWRYFFYRVLIKSTPMWMRDRLVQRFVVVPPWQTDEK